MVTIERYPKNFQEFLYQFKTEDDGWSGYSSLSQSKHYNHKMKIISGSGQEAHELLPHVHMVDSLVKR